MLNPEMAWLNPEWRLLDPVPASMRTEDAWMEGEMGSTEAEGCFPRFKACSTRSEKWIRSAEKCWVNSEPEFLRAESGSPCGVTSW